jgi:hypothetical protein
LLLLLPEDFFSPPWLARLLLPLLEALARSLCAALFWVLALPPLLAASDLPDEDDDFELPDFMEISFWLVACNVFRPATGLL